MRLLRNVQQIGFLGELVHFRYLCLCIYIYTVYRSLLLLKFLWDFGAGPGDEPDHNDIGGR